MNKTRMLAFAVTLLCVVAIASYYLFGGPLKISLFFPAPTFYQPNLLQIPALKPMTPGPGIGPLPTPLPSPKKPAHPSMRTPSRTDVLLHMSPAPYMPMPANAVTPPPAPTYAPVTPPPYVPSKPVITLPQPYVPTSPPSASPTP
jgi:hypothetical protein